MSLDNSQHTDEQKRIQALAAGDMSALEEIYKMYRDSFIQWAGKKFQGTSREDLLDAWHDTIIMFYEQVRDKKLTGLTYQMKTYLFLIGYRRLIKIHKKAEKFDLLDGFDANKIMDDGINVVGWDDMEEEKRRILNQAVDDLPVQSQQILIHRFIEGKSVPEIMEAMGYASVNAVSVTLSRSLKRLKETIVERMAPSKEWKK